MTRKHFEMIARVLRENRDREYSFLVSSMTEALAQTNPNFDSARFIHACLTESK